MLPLLDNWINGSVQQHYEIRKIEKQTYAAM